MTDTDRSQAALADLGRQGVANAQVGPRPNGLPMTVLVVRDPPGALVGRMRELQPAYPGAAFRVGSCTG